jgi:site-specific recombinase XerC
MANVHEDYTTEEQRSVVRLLWAKGLIVNDIHKEMFLVYSGKCLSCKAVHNWVEKRGKRYADNEEIEMEVRKWLRHKLKTSMLRVSTDW